MENNNFIIPIFIHWLKENDLYWLVRYNIAHYPSKQFTFENWLGRLYSKAVTKQNLFSDHTQLIASIPFDWKMSLTELSRYGIITKNGSREWCEVQREWINYLQTLRKKYYV